VTSSVVNRGLQLLLAPRSIAIIGASEDPKRIGGRVVAYQKRHFPGVVIPVNPRHTEVQGLAAVAQIGDSDVRPDLAIIATPAATTPRMVAEAAAAGVGAAIVFAGGFAEAGETGGALQQELAEVIRQTGIRVMGPNCVGLINLTEGVVATFTGIIEQAQLHPGNVAIISQSGAFGFTLLELAAAEGMGVSVACTTGNEVDITATELLTALLEREDLTVFALALESVPDPAPLVAAGRRARQLGKQIVALTIGHSEMGALAAASHSARLATPARALDAALRDVGVLPVRDPRELLDLVKGFVPRRLPRGRRIGVVTSSGGVGALIADEISSRGLTLDQSSSELQASLSDLVPSFGSVANPIDYTAQIANDMSTFPELLKRVTDAAEFDMVLVASAMRHLGPPFRNAIRDAGLKSEKPFIVWSHQPDVAAELAAAGIAVVTEPLAAVTVARALVDTAEFVADDLEETPITAPLGAPFVEPGDDLPEHLAAPLLARYGIDVVRGQLAESAEEALSAAESLGGHVVLKLSAPWLAHASDTGAVRLGVARGEVRSVAAELLVLGERIRPADGPPASLLIVEQIPAGIELHLGVVRGPGVGPMLTLGLGGTAVELIDEQTLLPAPASPAAARRALARIAGGRLLSGRRRLSRASADAVVQTVVALGALAVHEPAIRELDINPLIVGFDRAVAVDAHIITADEERVA
jgi:acyl-CoA synthetase (NDP forming)